MPFSRKTLVMIPTYDEASNVEAMCRALCDLGQDFDILFVDDNSPDGTGRIIDGLCREFGSVHALHRDAKQGVGSAHQAGIGWAYDRRYQTLLTMDCDFTHAPEQVREFLQRRDRGDVIVGSRFIRRGSIDDWVWYRKVLTHGAHALIVLILGLPHDASGAFRVYDLTRIPRALFSLVRDPGYAFFWESLYILWVNGHSIHEIPITLSARTYGTSKIRLRDVVHSFFHLFSVWMRKTWRARTIMVSPAGAGGRAAPAHRANSAEEWDAYWRDKGEQRPRLYDVIAGFYRRRIIRPSLIRFISRYFTPGERLLHAGCGGGEVDYDVVARMKVTAMDISPNALRRYTGLHGDGVETLSGSIDDIPLKDRALDGVYNLGVMEHFSWPEILAVLREFRRIVKPGGKIILFWAPRFGLSVMGLKVIHFILNTILRRKTRLHPDEPCLMASRTRAREVLEEAGFQLLEYSFGFRDFFTYAVLVGQRPSAP